jgi:hypothetical protein
VYIYMSYTIITGQPAEYITLGITNGKFIRHTDDSIDNIYITDRHMSYYKIDGGYVHLPTFASEAGDKTLLDVFGETVSPIQKEVKKEVPEDPDSTDSPGMKRIGKRDLKKKFVRYLIDHPKQRIPEVMEHFNKEYGLTDEQKSDMKCKWVPYKKPEIKKEFPKSITATV